MWEAAGLWIDVRPGWPRFLGGCMEAHKLAGLAGVMTTGFFGGLEYAGEGSPSVFLQQSEQPGRRQQPSTTRPPPARNPTPAQNQPGTNQPGTTQPGGVQDIPVQPIPVQPSIPTTTNGQLPANGQVGVNGQVGANGHFNGRFFPLAQ